MPENSKKIVIGLSGGMDSATLLGDFIDQGYRDIHCCIFHYGSKHNSYENLAALNVIEFYRHRIEIPGLKIYDHKMDLAIVMKDFNSALLLQGEEIPEGHYNDNSMKKTVVPGRNLIFASLMAGLAESIGAAIVGLGVHSGDHHIYPDCRPDFINSLNQTISYSTEQKVKIIAPFEKLDKGDILLKGFNFLPVVPYHLTRTCYKDQKKSCGKCGSCIERLEAFEKVGVTDLIDYE